MADSSQDLKQLKIKASSVKRIQKEYSEYKKEEEKQRLRITKLQAGGADSHDINKQTEVLQETLQMYPNIIQRLNDAVNLLQNFLDEGKVGESDEKNDAIDAINNAKDFLSTINPAQ